MLGMQMAVTSSQSYYRILQSVLCRIVVCRIFIADYRILQSVLCRIVVCRIFIADRARFAGMIPPLDLWHVGRAVRLIGVRVMGVDHL